MPMVPRPATGVITLITLTLALPTVITDLAGSPAASSSASDRGMAGVVVVGATAAMDIAAGTAIVVATAAMVIAAGTVAELMPMVAHLTATRAADTPVVMQAAGLPAEATQVADSRAAAMVAAVVTGKAS